MVLPRAALPVLPRQDERRTESEADLLASLGELDDPEWLKRPQDYSRGSTAARFSGLVTRLESCFAAHYRLSRAPGTSASMDASSCQETQP